MKAPTFAIFGAFALAACSANPVAADQTPDQADKATAADAEGELLTNFFRWWNEAYRTPGAYTADAFRRWFTEDATLTLEGREVIRGVDQWAAHFQRIQAGGGEVEIVVPFKETFESGDRIYTYHVIRSRRDGKTACSLAAGHATVEGTKLSSIVLVRSDLDRENGVTDPACWND
ncbi:hypothetical protein [Sphingosinicella sp. CPCC 101087]|uniref:hypothetical protein n=1 Tax=Sphingosinicella sp. CPCC 101087 TaxID=2497754 RepID=UPI001FB05939|nr:hypothetical protein [Sphingosinicella sp. CPCC 101087]